MLKIYDQHNIYIFIYTYLYICTKNNLIWTVLKYLKTRKYSCIQVVHEVGFVCRMTRARN